MRLVLGALIFLVFPALAMAQSERLIATCKSSKTEFEKRLRACDKVIELMAKAPQAWPFAERGDALGNAGQHERALDDFQRALAIEPSHVGALSDQVYSAYRLERYDFALTAVTKLLKVQPDDHWNHYIQGQILRELDRPDEALVAFEASIALKDDYFWSRYRRAFVFMQAEEWQKAEQDFLVAVTIDPLHSRAQLALADAYYKQGKGAPAARHYQIAQTLEPNFTRPAYRIEELVSLDPAPTLAPMSYRQPGTGAQYLMTLLPVDPRSEMERSIMAIANWFSAEPKATPEAMAILDVRTAVTKGDEIAISTEVLNGWKIPKGSTGNTQSFRGLFPLLIEPGGPQGPQIRTRYDGDGPAGAWPLIAGKSLSGTGSFAIVCPEVFNLGAALIGCRPSVIEVPVGRLEFNLYVDRVEDIFVPMGTFRTYVLRYRELSFLELGGVKRDRVIETTWWIDPQTGLWVKRTGEQGGKIVTLQALGMAGP